MMNTKENIQKFVNQEFGEIRILVLDGEPWFVGKDIAQALGYKLMILSQKLLRRMPPHTRDFSHELGDTI